MVQGPKMRSGNIIYRVLATCVLTTVGGSARVPDTFHKYFLSVNKYLFGTYYVPGARERAVTKQTDFHLASLLPPVTARKTQRHFNHGSLQVLLHMLV